MFKKCDQNEPHEAIGVSPSEKPDDGPAAAGPLACTACASALSLPPRSLSLSAGEIIVNRCSLLGKCEVTPMRCLIRLTVEKKEVMRKGMTVEDYNTMEIA